MTTRERTLLLGGQRLEGVYFVPAQPMSRVPRFHRRATKTKDILHVATDDLTRTPHIRDRIISEIRSAKTKVLFCSFLFADDEVVSCLCKAAEKLRGGVYVLTAMGKDVRPEIHDVDADIGAHDMKLRERALRHEEHLRSLAQAGVWLRGSKDCHAKFCVIDDESVIVTSANATQEAYEANPEDGLVIRRSDVARELGRVFSFIWHDLTTQESKPGERINYHELKSISSHIWKPLAGACDVVAVATIREFEQSLLKGAIDVIDSALKTLSIATYSLIGIQSPHPLGEAIERAVSRGVKIRVLVQPRNHHKGQRDTLQWLLSLGANNVSLYGHKRTHTKSIVADGTTVLLWTGNLEAAHGWHDGIEVGILARGSGVGSVVEGWTTDVMRRATHDCLLRPSVDELCKRLDGWNVTGDWIVNIPNDQSSEKIGDLLERWPVEVVEQNGRKYFRCGPDSLMDIEFIDADKQINLKEIRRVDDRIPLRPIGWLTECRLKILQGTNSGKSAPEKPTSRSGPAEVQIERKGKGKGR